MRTVHAAFALTASVVVAFGVCGCGASMQGSDSELTDPPRTEDPRAALLEDSGPGEGKRREDAGGASRFVGQELDQLESPFTRETVLTLNEIVGRSFGAITEFDDARKRLGATGEARAAELGSVYGRLSAKAARARVDMNAAAERLRESGERYNREILSAMVRFVEQVDDEIREEADRLRLLSQRSSTGNRRFFQTDTPHSLEAS